MDPNLSHIPKSPALTLLPAFLLLCGTPWKPFFIRKVSTPYSFPACLSIHSSVSGSSPPFPTPRFNSSPESHSQLPLPPRDLINNQPFSQHFCSSLFTGFLTCFILQAYSLPNLKNKYGKQFRLPWLTIHPLACPSIHPSIFCMLPSHILRSS